MPGNLRNMRGCQKGSKAFIPMPGLNIGMHPAMQPEDITSFTPATALPKSISSVSKMMNQSLSGTASSMAERFSVWLSHGSPFGHMISLTGGRFGSNALMISSVPSVLQGLTFLSYFRKLAKYFLYAPSAIMMLSHTSFTLDNARG